MLIRRPRQPSSTQQFLLRAARWPHDQGPLGSQVLGPLCSPRVCCSPQDVIANTQNEIRLVNVMKRSPLERGIILNVSHGDIFQFLEHVKGLSLIHI